jgi:hypothetical protein
LGVSILEDFVLNQAQAQFVICSRVAKPFN